MVKLSELVPLNLANEKAKFFAANYNYNPQFVYARSISEAELTAYGKPKLSYLFLAKYLWWRQRKAGATISIKQGAQVQHLSQASVEAHLLSHLRQYHLENTYRLVFSANFVSRVSVHLKNKEIKIALPIRITRDEIAGVLAHEIDTHLLRQHNYEQQLWYKKKKSYGLGNHLRTEEGLANIHQMIAQKQIFAYKSVINYLATDLALKKDFQSVFKFLLNNCQNPEKAWAWTLKKKRGLTDTSQKGAFTKDIVYFEGLLETLNYLRQNNYDPSQLYYGKIAAKDVSKVEKISTTKPLLLPKIYNQNPQLYKEQVQKLIQNNRFLF